MTSDVLKIDPEPGGPADCYGDSATKCCTSYAAGE